MGILGRPGIAGRLVGVGLHLLIASLVSSCETDEGSVGTRCASPEMCRLTTGTAQARLVAVGIPGAGAIRQVGRFLDTSPIAAQAPFAAFTRPGQVLAPERLLVASTSNFGAPVAREDHLPGSILSLDVTADTPVTVPADFAAAGGQAATPDGRVRVYSAQSPAFLNSVYRPDAVTATFTNVSHPLGISINNAFGRPWFANSPTVGGDGSITVTDPDGRPLAAVVSPTAGGVFTGSRTNRAVQLVEGALRPAAVGTVFLGPSPDGSRRAVFAAVNADGSLAQVHVQLGVDGLAAPGLIGSVEDDLRQARVDPSSAEVTHVGVVFNWIPLKTLFVADPRRNAIVKVDLTQESVFRVARQTVIASEHFKRPMDLAPAVVETVSPEFASGTTLAGGADLYVLNRGNGTIVRMTNGGTVVAVRTIEVAGLGLLGPNQLNGIATSEDGKRVWVTVTGAHPAYPGAEGMVLVLDAFGFDGQ